MAKTVGIIGGGGWLGGAIAEKGLSAGVLSPERLVVSSRSPRGERLGTWPSLTWTSDNADLVRRCDIVVLSVRPEDFSALGVDLTGKLVISVMAGISMATLRKAGCDRIVRTMPNAAAEIGRSFTPWVASSEVEPDDRSFVKTLFAACGDEDEVETEQQLDFLSGLSGTGPAYPALLALALLDSATKNGIPSPVALKAVRGVIASCGLMDTDDFNPAKTVQTFLDYRGVTAAGLKAMVEQGLFEAADEGLVAAARAAADMAERNAG
jgi:pyrroline-5-carboxylate reductase